MSRPKPIRVLQICSSSATSGAERHVLSLSQLLKARGHQVSALVPDPGWLTDSLQQSGVPIVMESLKGLPSLHTLLRTAQRVRRQKIHVVHTHLTRAAYFGNMLEIVTRVPLVTSVHIANNDMIYKRLARRRNRLVAVSGYVGGMLHGRGVPEKYVETIYNGTDFGDLQISRPEDVKLELGLESDSRLVGLIAKVCRNKGHIELLAAMKEVVKDHPKAHVLFVGRVEEGFETELDESLRSNGLKDKVTVTGERHDIPRMLDALTLCTLPSKMETFGLAAIEAMARGRAVVATRVGALPELVRNGQTGLLVDLRPESIAEAVDYLLANDEEREQMGRQGRRLVEQKFTLRDMVSRFESLYSTVAAIA